jgi:hypothetical protein
MTTTYSNSRTHDELMLVKSVQLLKEVFDDGSITGVGSALNVCRDGDGRPSIRAQSLPEDAEPPAEIEIMLRVIKSSAFQRTITVFPRNEITARTVKGGAPAHQPDFILYLIITMASRIGSQREAVKFLKTSPTNWRAVRRALSKAFPQFTIPLQPPRRSHLQHFVRRAKSAEGQVWNSKIREILREEAINQAQRMGLLPEDSPFSYRHLDLRQWVVSDGTIFKPPSNRKRKTKETQHIDDASGHHIKNGRDSEFGTQFALVSTRTLDRHSRVVLDVEHVAPVVATKRSGNEGETIHRMVCQLKEEIPGLRGLVVDSIIRGNRLVDLAERGVHVTNYPHAQSNPNRSTEQRMAPDRVEKSHKITSATHERRNGRPCKHDIYAEGGQIFTGAMDVKGNVVMVPLEVVKYEERRSGSGKYKYYFNLRIRCGQGDFHHRIGLFHTAEGELNFNRGEYVRLYAPGQERFFALYGRRNDTENSHSNYKGRMTRMRAYGAQMQTLMMLGLMLQENVVTDYVWQLAARLRKPAA